MPLLGKEKAEQAVGYGTDSGLLLQALLLKGNSSTILNANSVLNARPDDHESYSARAMFVCDQQNQGPEDIWHPKLWVFQRI